MEFNKNDSAEKVIRINLDTDLNASVTRLEELRNNRQISDISISDEYWKALKKHRAAHNKSY